MSQKNIILAQNKLLTLVTLYQNKTNSERQ